jgi:hypothetical protein
MEEEKEITKNRIKEAAEYLFKIIKEPQERRIKIKRGCDTYGLQDWGTHCQNENCEPCNRHMKEFDKLCKEVIQERLEELKNTE